MFGVHLHGRHGVCLLLTHEIACIAYSTDIAPDVRIPAALYLQCKVKETVQHWLWICTVLQESSLPTNAHAAPTSLSMAVEAHVSAHTSPRNHRKRPESIDQ